MADQTTTETPARPKASEVIAEREREITSLRAEIAELKADKRRDDERAAARAAERIKAIEGKEPPKLIGTIPVYLQDTPDDIVERATPLFAGRVPLDRATKFQVTGNLTPLKEWPIFERLNGRPPKIGETFDRGEIPPDEVAAYAAAGAVIAVA